MWFWRSQSNLIYLKTGIFAAVLFLIFEFLISTILTPDSPFFSANTLLEITGILLISLGLLCFFAFLLSILQAKFLYFLIRIEKIEDYHFKKFGAIFRFIKLILKINLFEGIFLIITGGSFFTVWKYYGASYLYSALIGAFFIFSYFNY